MVDEDTQDEIIEEKGPKKSWLLKIITIIIFVFTWVAVLIIGTQIEISLRYPLIISIVISVFAVVGFFGSEIAKKFNRKKEEQQEQEKMPHPITEEEVITKLNKTIEKLMNHIRIDNGILGTRPHNINKNLIYEFKLHLLYPEQFGNKEIDTIYVLINATYPNIMPTILPTTISQPELGRAINSISSNPKDEPDIEETKLSNPLTGVEQTTRKVIQPRKTKKSKTKREDSVV